MTRLLSWCFLASSLLAGPARAATPAPPAVVIELFTSEGCSSCPPAEAVLGRLAREGVDGNRVLLLSEHVNYWDGLGWADRFASPELTARQGRYARRLGLPSIYTPQAVVNGEADAVGSDAGALRAAVRAAAQKPRGVLALRREIGAVAVEGTWARGRATVYVAILEDGARSVVTRGENAGRTLEHAGVVRWLGAAGEGDGGFRGAVTVPEVPHTGALRLVAFAQLGGDGPLVAVGELGLRDER